MDGCAYMVKGRLYTNAINYMRCPNFHTCVGSGHFLGGGGGGQKFEFQHFFVGGGGGVQKMNIFWGMKICGYFLGSITKLDYI